MYKYQEIRPYESDFNRLQDFVLRNPKTMFSVREKIHGANFQVLVDSYGNIQYFSREQEIPELKNFYGCDVVVDRIASKISDLVSIMEIKYRDLINNKTSILVFGELAGNQSSGKRIQTGIEYGESDFYVFDIVIADETDPENVVKYYLSDIATNILCSIAGLEVAPILGAYTLEKINEIGVPCFQSQIVEGDVGVVDEESGIRNLAEGVIIKAYDPRDIWNPKALRYNNGRRVIAKWKAKRWSEKKNRAPKVIKKMSEKDQDLFNSMIEYLHENRVAGVMSKLADQVFTPNDYGRILGLFTSDALKDYLLDVGVTSLSELDIDDRNLLMRSFNSEATDVLRPVWISTIMEQDQ